MAGKEDMKASAVDEGEAKDVEAMVIDNGGNNDQDKVDNDDNGDDAVDDKKEEDDDEEEEDDDDEEEKEGDLVKPKKNDVVSTKLRSWYTRHEGTLYYTDLISNVLPNLPAQVENKMYRAIGNQIYTMIRNQRGGRFIRLNDPIDGPSATTGIIMTEKESVHKIAVALRTAHMKWLSVPSNSPSRKFSGDIAHKAVLSEKTKQTTSAKVAAARPKKPSSPRKAAEVKSKSMSKKSSPSPNKTRTTSSSSPNKVNKGDSTTTATTAKPGEGGGRVNSNKKPKKRKSGGFKTMEVVKHMIYKMVCENHTLGIEETPKLDIARECGYKNPRSELFSRSLNSIINEDSLLMKCPTHDRTKDKTYKLALTEKGKTDMPDAYKDVEAAQISFDNRGRTPLKGDGGSSGGGGAGAGVVRDGRSKEALDFVKQYHEEIKNMKKRKILDGSFISSQSQEHEPRTKMGRPKGSKDRSKRRRKSQNSDNDSDESSEMDIIEYNSSSNGMCYHIIMEEEQDNDDNETGRSSSARSRKPILEYTLDLILTICNQTSIDPVIAYRILDTPIFEDVDDEPDKERRARLQLRHRYASASAAGISPLDFSHKLANMWGAKLIYAKKNQYPPRSRERYQRKNPKAEDADVDMNDIGGSEKAASEAEQTSPSGEAAVALVVDDTDAASASTAAGSSIEQQQQQQQQQQALASGDNVAAEDPTKDELLLQPPASVAVEEPQKEPQNGCIEDKQNEPPSVTSTTVPQQVPQDSAKSEQIEKPQCEGSTSEVQPAPTPIASTSDVDVTPPAVTIESEKKQKESAVEEVELPFSPRASSKGSSAESGECTTQ